MRFAAQAEATARAALGCFDLRGELTVADHLALSHAQEKAPDFHLKGGPAQIERQIRSRGALAQVRIQRLDPRVKFRGLLRVRGDELCIRKLTA